MFAKPTTRLPAIDTTNPAMTDFLIGSLRTTGDRSATHRGVVVTNTIELAMEVNDRELIQVVKCSAKKIPDRVAFPKSFLDKRFHSSLCFIKTNGTRIKLATIKREAAITIAEASSWANLMNIDAVETHNIPRVVARIGWDFFC